MPSRCWVPSLRVPAPVNSTEQLCTQTAKPKPALTIAPHADLPPGVSFQPNLFRLLDFRKEAWGSLGNVARGRLSRADRQHPLTAAAGTTGPDGAEPCGEARSVLCAPGQRHRHPGEAPAPLGAVRSRRRWGRGPAERAGGGAGQGAAPTRGGSGGTPGPARASRAAGRSRGSAGRPGAEPPDTAA